MKITAVVALLAAFLLGGCTTAELVGAASEIKDASFGDFIEATKRNHAFRFDSRAECRRLAMEEARMYSNKAVVAEENDQLFLASQYRKQAAAVLNANFPELITVQVLEQAQNRKTKGLNFDKLDCFKGYSPEEIPISPVPTS